MTTKYLNKLNEAQFNRLSNNWFKTILYWIIDSKYGKAKRLDKFISDQLDYHFDLMACGQTNALIDLANRLKGNNPYHTVYKIEHWVWGHIDYLSDIKNWSMNEYWADAEAVFGKKVDDCDGQNSLIHILCRLAGITGSNLYSCIGDVDGDGTNDHYWTLFFDARRDRFVKLDTTYYPEIKPIHQKKEFKQGGKYKKLNYAFNENGIWKFK